MPSTTSQAAYLAWLLTLLGPSDALLVSNGGCHMPCSSSSLTKRRGAHTGSLTAVLCIVHIDECMVLKLFALCMLFLNGFAHCSCSTNIPEITITLGILAQCCNILWRVFLMWGMSACSVTMQAWHLVWLKHFHLANCRIVSTLAVHPCRIVSTLAVYTCKKHGWFACRS